MSFITAIGTATPHHRFPQATIADFMVKAMRLDKDNSRKLKTIFKASGIEYRHSVLSDYGKHDNFIFYPNSEDAEPFPTTEQRLRIFRQCALPLSVDAVRDLQAGYHGFDPQTITHLIVVCCTGMYAPGLDVELVKALQLPWHVERTNVTFMGCHAAFNALKLADAICTAKPDARVLIVCTELCSLHFQKKLSEDNLLANALFADGSAALLVEANVSQPRQLKLQCFYNSLAPEGAGDMAWEIGNVGFEMKLSAYIPDLIRKGMVAFTNRLLSKVGKSVKDIHYVATHPGGKKILEAIEQALGLTKEQNAPAYHVLRNFGNMSSPTVVFVLQEIYKALTTADHGKDILSFAFGPGLTMESMVLQVHNHPYA
jgi:prepilin-type processing-associated H-X9-DG protein